MLHDCCAFSGQTLYDVDRYPPAPAAIGGSSTVLAWFLCACAILYSQVAAVDLFDPALDVVAAIIHAMHTAKRVFGQAELKPR